MCLHPFKGVELQVVQFWTGKGVDSPGQDGLWTDMPALWKPRRCKMSSPEAAAFSQLLEESGC